MPTDELRQGPFRGCGLTGPPGNNGLGPASIWARRQRCGRARPRRILCPPPAGSNAKRRDSTRHALARRHRSAGALVALC